MNLKRLAMAGLAASILFLALDAILGTLGGLIAMHLFHSPMEQPPGIEDKVAVGLIFEFANGFMLAGIYRTVQSALPGTGWRKGIRFGLIVWGLRVIMWGFSTYMMTDMAPALILIYVVTGFIEVLILGAVIAAILEKREDPGDAPE